MSRQEVGPLEAGQAPGQGMSRRGFLQTTLRFSVGASLAMSGLSLLTACGTSPNPRQPATPGGAASPAAAGGGAPAVVKKGPVRYWTFLNPKDNNPRSQAQNQLLQNFTKATRIEVEVEVVPWQEIEQKLIQATQAGKGPDISRARNEMLPEMAASGSIVPLDDVAASLPKRDRDDFIMPWDATLIDGKKYSFFAEHRVQLLFYRKDLLEKAGLQVPQTWADFAAAAARLTADPLWGTVIPLSKKGQASGLYQWFLPALWGYGADLFGDGWQARFNGPEGVACFQLLYDLVHKFKGMPLGAVAQDIEAVTQGMMAGNVAMAIIGSHRVSYVRTAAATKTTLGLARIPGPQQPSPTHEAGWNYVVSKDVRDKETAWRFVEYMISPDAQLLYTKMAGELPTRKSVLDDPWFETPEAADVAFAVRYLLEKPRAARYPRRFGALAEALADAAQAVVQGLKSPKAALDEVAAKWDKELRSA